MEMTKCPKCGADNSVRRDACFNCGTLIRPTEVGRPRPQPERSARPPLALPSQPPVHWIWYVVVVVAAFIFVASRCRGPAPQQETPAPPTASVTAAPQDGAEAPGDTGGSLSSTTEDSSSEGSTTDSSYEPSTANPLPEASETHASSDSDIVYATETGDRYHRHDCRFLRKSAIGMTRADAKAQGLSPCEVCKP